MVFDGGGGGIFLNKLALLGSIFYLVQNVRGLKILRHTKSSIYMYVAIYITPFNCSGSITFV